MHCIRNTNDRCFFQRQRRVQAAQDSVTLDLHDCHVDGVDIEEAMRQGIGNVGVEPLRAMAALFVTNAATFI